MWNEIVTSCVELASFNARDALRQLDYAGVTVSLKSSLLLLLLPTFLMIEGIARDRSYNNYSWWYTYLLSWETDLLVEVNCGHDYVLL